MNLNAQRHLDNGLGQIHRLDNARVLKNAGFGKRTQSKKKNKDTLQEWHDSLWKRVASDEAKRKEKIGRKMGSSWNDNQQTLDTGHSSPLDCRMR